VPREGSGSQTAGGTRPSRGHLRAECVREKEEPEGARKLASAFSDAGGQRHAGGLRVDCCRGRADVGCRKEVAARGRYGLARQLIPVDRFRRQILSTDFVEAS
jgi:hypothetical protein